MIGWTLGLLVVSYTIAVVVQSAVDATRDILAPYRVVPDLPRPGPDAFTVPGAVRVGAWSGGLVPGAHVTVTDGWIGIRRRTLWAGVRHHRVDRSDVASVVVVTGFPQVAAGIGIRGHERTSRLTVSGSNRAAVEQALDRLGWPHERRRPRLLRPFA